MEPAERDSRNADSDSVPDPEVELSTRLEALSTDPEPPSAAGLATDEPEVQGEIADEDKHEMVWSDPQDVPSSPSMTQEDPLDDQPKPQKLDKGKKPLRANYAPAFCESEAGSSHTVPAPEPAPSRDTDLSPASTAGLMHGQPIPWELDPERPAQKLPIRFKDAVGRTMLIPWRRAKTWDGMKMTIDSQFMGPDGEGMDTVLGNSVANGRYSLHVSLPLTLEPPKRRGQGKGNFFFQVNVSTKRGSSSDNINKNSHINFDNIDNDHDRSNNNDRNNNDDRGNNNDRNNNNDRSNNNTPQPDVPSTFPMRPMVLLPEFWDDLIQPGTYVTMTMWPRLGRGFHDIGPPGGIPGLPPHHVLPPGMNPGLMAPMAPPPPQPHFIRIVGGPGKVRPKTKASSGRPMKRP
ncbi:hypothetical protein EDB81DRAFT_465326 [Dactylonectria macrodidyma]|uniref:Ubiquitin-like domain-containing protein n=1 Tax=Dactylonectria macrodidyma TaxID=307937 RepID=A0A9P9EYN3_9HYPO|nr:hypothetical protein EDB81DRAFT_465326 [Dactylonectria macrodidyma]